MKRRTFIHTCSCCAFMFTCVNTYMDIYIYTHTLYVHMYLYKRLELTCGELLILLGHKLQGLLEGYRGLRKSKFSVTCLTLYPKP